MKGQVQGAGDDLVRLSVARLMAAVAAREAVVRARPPRSARDGFQLTTLGGEADGLVERRLPSTILKRLGPDHPLVNVAERYAELTASVGSMGGVSLAMAASSGVSDGGAVAKVGDAQQLERMREELARRPVLGARRRKGAGGRMVTQYALSARQLVDGVLIEGHSLAHLIRASGRDAQSPTVRRKCAAELIAALTRMASHVGR